MTERAEQPKDHDEMKGAHAGHRVATGEGKPAQHHAGHVPAMHDNQQWLVDLGLNTPNSDKLCEIALAAGALAAKITGAGGGGCVIALAPRRQQEVLDAWRASGFEAFAIHP